MLRQVILSLTFEAYSEMIGHGAVVSGGGLGGFGLASRPPPGARQGLARLS